MRFLVLLVPLCATVFLVPLCAALFLVCTPLLMVPLCATASPRETAVRIDIIPQIGDLIPEDAIAFLQVTSIRDATSLLSELSSVWGGKPVALPGVDSTLMDPTRPFGVACSVQDSLELLWIFQPADSSLVRRLDDAGVPITRSGNYIGISDGLGSLKHGSVGWIGKSLLAGTMSVRFKMVPIAALMAGTVDSLAKRVDNMLSKKESGDPADAFAFWLLNRMGAIDTFDLAFRKSNRMFEIPFALEFKQGAESLLVSAKDVQELPEVMACLPATYDLLMVGASTKSELVRISQSWEAAPARGQSLPEADREAFVKTKQAKLKLSALGDGPYAFTGSMGDHGLELVQVISTREPSEYKKVMEEIVTGGAWKSVGYEVDVEADSTIVGVEVDRYHLKRVHPQEGGSGPLDTTKLPQLFPGDMRIEVASRGNRVVILVNSDETRMKATLERLAHPPVSDLDMPPAWKTTSGQPLCFGMYADVSAFIRPFMKNAEAETSAARNPILMSLYATSGKKGYAGALALNVESLAEQLHAVRMAASLDSSVADPMAAGLERYQKNEINQARALFEEAITRSPSNAEAHAYYSDANRRLGNATLARQEAELALSLDPKLGFAHEILGCLKQDVKDDAGATDEFLKAVACDPKNGSPWLALWIQAIKAGDRTRERTAIQKLHETSFFTPAAMAYGRWTLQDAPKNCVLISNGDMDTYTIEILQQVQHVRTDVTLVNISMLNASWYRDYLARNYELPVRPEFPEEVDSTGARLPQGVQQVEWWAQEGRLKRPLAIAVTVPVKALWSNANRDFVLVGAVYRHEPNTKAVLDTALVRRSLRGVRVNDFSGPMIGEQDRSPVRTGSSNALKGNITALAVTFARALLEANRDEDAWAAAEFAREFEYGAKPSVTYGAALISFDATLANHYEKREDYVTGDSLFSQTVTLMEANGDTTTVGYFLMEMSLASMKAERRRFDEAERLFNRSHDGFTALMGPRHYLVAGALDGLGMLYQRKGNYSRGAELQREALAIIVETMTPESIGAAACENNLGYTLLLGGAYEEAEKVLGHSMAVMRRSHDADPMLLAGVLDSMGDLYLRTNRAAAAESLLVEALAITEKEWGQGSLRFAKGQSILGSCLSELGRFGQAEPLLTSAYERMMAVQGTGGEDTLKTRDRLIQLYESWGKDEKARSLKAAH